MRFSGCCAAAALKYPASPEIVTRHIEKTNRLLANRIDRTLSPPERGRKRGMERAFT
jgi:hypothetical protein